MLIGDVLLEFKFLKVCGEKGIRTLGTLLAYTHFPGVRLRPLGHLSMYQNANFTKLIFGALIYKFSPREYIRHFFNLYISLSNTEIQTDNVPLRFFSIQSITIFLLQPSSLPGATGQAGLSPGTHREFVRADTSVLPMPIRW